MSLIRLCSYPTDLQYFLLDRMDGESLVALKHIDRESRDSFESDKIVHYLLACRLQQLIDRARPFGWCSQEHRVCVRKFFQLVSILPADIKFPKPCDYDKPSELKSLIVRLTVVISTEDIHLSDPLTERSFELSNVKDERMAAFMTCLATRSLHSTKRSWVELSRRFALSGHLDEEAFYANFCTGLQYICTNGAGDFIQGVSGDLLKSILNRFVGLITINYQLVWGFSQIEDSVEAHEKVIVYGNWFHTYATYSLQNAERLDVHVLEEFNRANTLMNILYIAAFADKKMQLDRTVVKSWIPKSFECWEKFSALAKHWDVFSQKKAVVKQHFGELFS